jgi:hypothetical protein
MPMSVIDITDIQFHRLDPEYFVAGHLDLPQPATHNDQYALSFSGWVLSRDTQAFDVVINSRDTTFHLCPLNRERPDVRDAYPDVPNAQMSGFDVTIRTHDFEPAFELVVAAKLRDGRSFPLATVRGRQAPIRPTVRSRMNPIVIDSQGRSGSTILMRYFSVHPNVIVSGGYPYEVTMVMYWLRVFEALTLSAGPQTDQQKETGTPSWIPVNPLNTPMRGKEALDAFHKVLIPRIADFCLESVDSFYTDPGVSADKSDAPSFAEKMSTAFIPSLFWQLYPAGKAVLLVRDPRDRYCSLTAFHEKRGYDGFGYTAYGDELTYLRNVRNWLLGSIASLKAHPGQVVRVRYEDLVLHPHAVLDRMFAELGVPCSAQELDTIIRVAQEDNDELRYHRTAGDAVQSVGRWRNEFSPELRTLFQDVLGDIMADFGYDP